PVTADNIIERAFTTSTSVTERAGLPAYTVVLDKNGIPYLNYGGSLGLQRNPLQIEQTALEYYDYYKKNGDQKALNIFLNNTNWLVDNAVVHSNYSFLEYQFPFPVPYPPSYTMKPPWHSSISQGEALPVLISAFKITGNKTYLATADML